MVQNNPTLEIKERSTNVFLLKGIINFDSILLLMNHVQNLKKIDRVITFDLSEVTQLDSSLVSYLLECRRNKKDIQLINMPTSLTSLINLYGLKDFFNLTDSHTLITV